MASPFDFLAEDDTNSPVYNFPNVPDSVFGRFGPNAGTNMQSGEGGAYTPGPEILPWGVQAAEQDRPLERLATDPAQGQASSQVTNPGDLRGQQKSPWYPPRAAAGEGTIMGFIDSLRGVPTRDQIAYGVDERAKQRENEATTAVLQRMTQIREANPKITPQQLSQAIYKDPVFLENALKHSPQEMSEFIGKVQEQLYGPSADQQKIQGFAPGTHVIQGVNQDGTPNVIYKVPEKLAQQPRAAQMVLGGSPEAAKYGLEGIAKPGERVEVKFRKTPDGQDIPDDFGFPDRAGVNIDLGKESNKELLQDVNKRAGDIRVAQGHIINAAETVNDIINDIEKQGNARNIGPVGFLLRMGQGAIEQARAIAELSPGVAFDVKEYPAMAAIVKSRGLDKMAADSAVIQSRILALAFELAAAQNRGGQVTQKDVNSAIEQIGANMGSTEQLKSALTDMIRRGVRRQDIFIAVQRDGMTDAEGKPLVPGRLPRNTADLMIERGLGRFTYNESQARAKDAEEAQAQEEANIPNTVRDSNGDIWDYKGSGSKRDKSNYKKRVKRGASGISTEEKAGPKVPR